MNAENQELLDAIRGIVAEAVAEAVAPLSARIVALETQLRYFGDAACYD